MRSSGGLSEVETTTTDALAALPGRGRARGSCAPRGRARRPAPSTIDVGGGAARHHAEQRALADAAAAEQADALAAAAGQQRVDGAHAGAERRDDRIALHRVERRRIAADSARRVAAAAAVERLAERVDDAAEQRRARRPPTRTAPRATMRSPGRMPAVSPSGTVSSVAVAEADHLHRQRRRRRRADDVADLADAGARPGRLDEQADGADDAAATAAVGVDCVEPRAMIARRARSRQPRRRRHCAARRPASSPSSARAISWICASTPASITPKSDSTRQPPRADARVGDDRHVRAGPAAPRARAGGAA